MVFGAWCLDDLKDESKTSPHGRRNFCDDGALAFWAMSVWLTSSCDRTPQFLFAEAPRTLRLSLRGRW
jgi:hypothetical protein